MHFANNIPVFRVVLFAAAASAACTRAFLRAATDRYISAQRRGSPDELAALAAPDVTYTENEVGMGLDRSVLTEAVEMDHTRSVLDTARCATFTEIIAASNAHQYVIGTRMEFSLSGGGGGGNNSSIKISRIESVVTDRGDWAFNATGYRYWNSLETWDPIPAARRDSRAVIQAAGDAYFNRFAGANVTVPFGVPCSRLEGGASTAPLNLTGDSCTLAGLPSALVVTDRRYVVDEEMGVVDIFLGFPGLDRSQGTDAMPDSHMFRVEAGQIRYIHTVSACVQAGCGMNGVGPPQSRPRKPRLPPPAWRPRLPSRYLPVAKRRVAGY